MGTKQGLTVNEKKTLLILVENARATDSEIASKIKITPQGVRKIRKKLEQKHILQYRTILDYGQIGINVFALARIKVINNEILKNKNIIGAFEINEANITHLLILGFNSLEELDKYKKTLLDSAELQKIDVVSQEGFLKHSPIELIKKQLKN